MKKIYPAISHNTKLKAKSVSLILSLFIFLFGMTPWGGVAQSISVTNITTTPICAGSDVTVTFDVTNGIGVPNYFTASTDYQIFLSDAGGTVFTPQGSTFNNSTQTYDITDGGTTTGLTQTFTIPVATAAGAGYKISIGSSGPVFDASTGGGASAAFTINAIAATPGAITGTSTVCDNTSGNAFSIIAVAGATGYTWTYAGTGATINGTGTNVTIDFATGATSGTLSVTADNTCGSSAPQTQAITVNPNPTANAGGALAAICQGATSAAMGGSVGGGATGGTWSGGAGTWTNANDPANATYTAGAAESGSITLTLTTSGGSCGTTSDTKTITVNQDPTANAGGALSAICQGATSAAMAGSVGGGATGGTWSGGAGTWTNANDPVNATYTAGAAESGSITLTLTTSGGLCGTTSDSKTITVNPNPTANAGGALTAICQGATSAAMGGSVGGGATGGTWTGGAGTWTNANDPANATYTAGAAESGSITLTLTTSGGSCGTTSDSKTITVTPNNTAGAPSSSPTLCISTAISPNITIATTGATGISNDGVSGANGLPAGVSAHWAANTITISGTPTASGTFNYSIPLTGGCGSVNATGTITVTPANTAGAPSSTPTLCINTVLTNITIATTGATGISNDGVSGANGLPAGVSAHWAANTITISGTPTASGTFTYSIPLTGGCGSVNATGTITVTPANTAGAPSSTPTLCINTVLTNITIATTGATGISNDGVSGANGLPAGVSAHWAANTITISGTPTASGTFNYSIPLTGGCGSVNATGTITVTPANTAGAPSSSPTLCINTVLTNITIATTGATGISNDGVSGANGLPAGVSAHWAANTITISGTPTASGTFNYSIPLTGGCGSVNATGTITVTPANTAGAPSSTPTLCINTVLTNITIATTGATGISNDGVSGANGLPAGVSAHWAANTITISGTPTASGTFNYSIALTGGCGSVNATGTISVTPNNTAGAPSSTPTLCINTSLTNITIATTGATGISNDGVSGANGLPAGVSAHWAANTITISGTPTASGTFTYSIPLTGGCGSVNATGTITVTPANTAGAPSSSPTLCINTVLTNITIATTGATGISNDGVSGANGLPAGVSAHWAANTITISGTPTASGTFNYSIPLTGGCGSVNATGTITVTPANTAGAPSSTPTLCINTVLTNITIATTGATGISNDGVSGANGLPAGVSAHWAANTITISGTPTASGTFNYSIALTGGCGSVNATGTISVTPNNTAGAPSSIPTLCINTSLTNITIATTGATGIANDGVSGANGLPTGVSAHWAAGVVTISGTPTVAGVFNYTITTTGGCTTPAVTATGTITVTANNTITLSSGAGTNNQTKCINVALTNITFTTTGATGIANDGVSGANGLPTGVSAHWAAGVVTISGTPTVAGVFNYTITTTGGCTTPAVTATGTITVTANNTITLSSGAGTNNQTKCINVALTNITFTTTGATGIANDGVSGANGLPTGVSAHWAAGVVTISGTPTVAGVFNYTITTTGGCTTPAVTATGTITVTANNTITLSSGAGTNNQTKCINVALTNITFTTTGATGIANDGVSGANGLPTGVSAHWAAGVVTISGTPTVAGVFNYTITTTGGCTTPAVTATGTITVTANNTITLSSGAGTNNQTLCINVALTNITFTTTGATGIANDGVSGANGLPTGVSAHWAAGVVTISGTPTVAGVFNYTITTTGGCTTPAVTATGTITVTANNTITLSSGAGTNNQTKCINVALTNITFTTTGATGIANDGVSGANGLPTGVSAHWAAGVVTISGTPTVAGVFNYTITTTGGCTTPAVTATGTITVTANNTITLSSGAGTNNQTLCINVALTNITFTTTGATGIANDGVSGANGLPAGVSAHWAAGVVTISGTPTVAGVFNYTITTTGGCTTPAVTATGTITVTANNTITLSSGAGTNNQTLCINVALTNITFTTTGATGIANDGVSGANGLPTGVSAHWAAGVVTISGTPTVAGVFNYTITTTGGCTTPAVTATGTITVTANNTITLSSGAGTNNQTKCINVALTNITFTTTGATGIANDGVSGANGLPTGVSAHWAAGVVTISGTPTVAGVFNYTITTTGGCTTPAVTATGTITVTANNTITLSSGAGTNNQTLCINVALTNITFTTTGATGIANDGVSGANGLPAGVSAHWAAGVVTISGTPTVAGVFNYTITTTGGCTTPAVTVTGTITVTPNNTITLTSAAGTNAQTVCLSSAITSITYSTTGATGATFSGLPAGVTGNWAANVVTISGTPAASGAFSYTVTTTGGCTTPAVTASGTITVNAPPVTTGVTICQGGSGSLTSSAGCAASTPGTAGPNFAGTGTDNNGTGAVAWTGPGNISANDNIYATATVSSGGTVNTSSHYLQATNFGFAIPANAIISGIQVSIKRFSSFNNGTNNIQDNVVSLIKAGAVTGNDNSLVGNWSTTNTTIVNYGTVSDLWGTTWTPAQINAANFGVALSVFINRTSGNTVTASVDYITITVSYTIPGTLNWYIVSSGGSAIGNGSPFNPVGVAGSGLPNTNTPGTYTFYAECTSAAPGCRTATNFIINALPTITGTTNICNGTTTQLTGSPTVAATNPWISSVTAVATVDNTGLVTSHSAGTTVITYTNNNGCITTATVTVNAGPVISGQPANQSTCAGTAKSFTVTLSAGTSPSYQWQYSPDNATWSNVITGVPANITYGGTTTATLTVTPSAAAANGTYYYRCIVSVSTCSSVTSNSATLAVFATPTISNSGPDQTICLTSVNTTLAANTPVNGTGVWSISSGPNNALSQISNVSNPTATFTPTTSGTYTLVWTISNGVCAASSDPVNIVVNAAPVISGQPANQSTCANTSKTFTVTLSAGTSPAYQWQYSPDNATWSNVANGTPANITYTNPTGVTLTVNALGGAANGTYYYRCIVSVNQCASATSTSATLTVYATPTASNSGPDQTICSSAISTPLAANTPTVGTGVWSITSGPSTSLSQISNVNNPTATFTWAGGAGTYVLVWTISNGVCAASSDPVNIVVNAAPVISVQPVNQITCAPTAKAFSVTLSAGTSPSYQWQYSPDNVTWSNVTNGTPANITYNNQNTATLTVTPSAASANGVYYYRCVVSVAQCASVISNSATLTVYAIPTTSVAGPDQTICSSTTTVTLAANTPVYGTGTWSVNAGSPSTLLSQFSNVNSPTATFTPAGGTGTYVLVWTISNGTCTASTDQVNIIVNPIPTGTLAATENSGTTANDNIICQGGSVTFSFSNSTYGSYIFKVNGVTKQTGTSNDFSTTTLNNLDQVTVDVANGFNCGATFGPITITVNPLPSPTLSASKNPICIGDNVTFTAGGGTSYNFKINGSSVQNSAATTYSTTAINNGDVVTVDVTNVNGCVATSAPIPMVVNGLPSGSLTASPGTTVCAGTNVTFTATAGFTSYQFYVNGVSVQGPGAANTYSTTTLTNGSVVTVTATNSSGCSKTFTGVLMTVNALPAGSIANTENSGTPNDNIICAGSQVTFTATAGFTNYAFYLNGAGGALQNGPSNVYSSTTLNNGDYVTAVVTNSNGCIATFTSTAITVIQPPSGSLTASSTTICAGTNIVFTATAGFTNYNFKLNGNPVQNGSSNTYNNSALANGDAVTVDVTNSNGCLSTFGPVTITVNGLPTGTIVPVENSGLTPNDGIICTGATVVFTAPTGFNNYDFLLNGVTIQSGPSNTYSNSTLNNGDQVTAAVTNGAGCVGVLNTITIKVNTLPVVAPITGASAVCVNSTITLSDITATGVWSSSNNSIASINASGVVTGVAAGTVTISYTVTNANGCGTTVTYSVTVNDVPTVSPVIGNFSVCVGSTTQLSDATAPGTWSSSNNGMATVDGTGLVTGVASGSVTISYSVTNANGCTTVVTALITVNDVPVVAAITGTMNVCVNNTTALADLTSGGTWSSGNTSIATINSSGIVTGVSAGSVIISYSVTNMQGCNTTVTANVTVNPLPVPTLNGPNPICPNSTDTYTTEAGQSNYAWAYTGGTLVSGGTATDNTITITWDQPGARTISVNYQNSFGCSAATSATVLTSSGTVPTLTGPVAVCLNSNGTYTTQTGQTAYTWIATGGSITAGGTGTDNTATINWNTAGTGSVSINFTDVNGCTGASPTVLPVTVHNLPTASISGNAAVCQNGPAQQVTFTGASGAAPYTFTYTINGGSNQVVTTTSGNSITVSVPTGIAGPYIYALVSVSDNNSCSQNQSGSVTVTVNPLPTATIGGATSVCQNSSSPNVTFTGTLGTAPFTFKYNINGGATQTVTTTSGNSVTVAAPTGVSGNFTYNLLSAADANGCFNPQSGSAVITVNPLPTATISGTVSVCLNGASPNITFTGAAGAAPYTFTYNINGGGNLFVTSVGNTATVSAPTNVAGTFTYNLLSVQDASSTTCSQSQSGSAIVTVNSTSVGGTVNASATVCSGSNSGILNLTGNTGNVIRWEFSTDGGVTWTAIANTTSSLTYTNITQTTQYRAVVQSGVCSSANSIAATITINAVSVGGSVANSATVCSGTNGGTLNLTGNTGNVIRWEFSTDGGVTWTVIANTTSSFTYTNITQTTQYRAVVQSGVCSSANSTAATITINPVSVGGSVANNAAVCSGTNGGTLNLSGQTGSVIRWEFSIDGGSTWSTIANTTTSQTYTNLIQTTLYRAVVQSGVCASANSATATITVNALPAAPTVTASPATICSGGSSNLVVTSAGGSPTTIVNYNFNSGASYATLTPALATNITSTVSGTATFGTAGGTASGANAFTANATAGNALTTVPNKNWVFTLGGTALPTYKTFNVYYQASRNPGGSNTITLAYSINGGAFITTGITSTVGGNPVTLANSATWYEVSLSLPAGANNPTTSLAFQLTVANSGTGNVQIDNFQVQATASITNTYSWIATPAATAGLPGSAGTPSTSNSNISVSPTATTQYTVTATNVSGCSSTANVTVTVNPVPTVTVTADYCIDAGKVRLTATSTPSGATFVWNTGQTGSIIDVDEASNDTVTATLATGCSASASIQVAQELVVNGDFESGGISPNTVIGFTSDYAFHPDVPGLVPAGQGELYDDSGNNGFSITPSGQNVHINFWGHDHTTGTGNFMAVNGHGNTLVVWKETVNVLPNTTYYFSAWAMSLNSSGNYAQLQFSVNGTLTGTTAVLAAHGQSNGSPDNWTRFYGTWTSGPTTTSAVIYINDLQGALSGNDFGIDDISFGTLSTFIELESGPGTDSQTVCVNTPITNIVYSVGSTASAPTIAGLPPGLTTSFNGILFTISGTPTAAGDYAYTVTTTGSCNPTTATGVIHVQSQTITLSSGTSTPTVCINTPVNIGYTLGGTATGATVTGLPAGVNISVAGTAVTISGSPTAAGVYPYTITTSGTCTPVTATGTITVQSQTITLNSANHTQTVCINNPIVNIQYTVGGTGTSASVSGLPAGVNGNYNSGFFVISGTPTVSGTFNYTVTTSGTCAAAIATGTITVTPAASLTLTSGAGSDAQVVCMSAAITNITYAVNNSTGASASGLPTGVTGSYSGGVFTISGAPSVAGTFTYTVTTSGGCGFGTATGSITVNVQTITLTSGSATPTLCINTILPSIAYTFGGTATSASVSGLPAGVNFAIAGSTITISGTPTVSGSFPYVVTTSGTCGQVTANGTITVQPSAIGGSIANVSICSGGSGSLTVTGQAGSIVRWEYSTDGGVTWTTIANTTITQTFTNVTVPTLYRVVVGNGCGNVTSTGGIIAIHNYWVGATNTDWNTASNWSDNLVPSLLCPDVYIPNTINKPILSVGPIATINNLHVFAGAVLTINGPGHLQVSGTITNLGTFDVTSGTIEYNGASAQTITVNLFATNKINNLIISNNVSLNGVDSLTGTLSFGSSNKTFTTNGNLTIKSTISGTGSVGQILNGNAITGNVTVERYIATGNTGAPNHGKSWQFLGIPTFGSQTIKAAWEEGATVSDVASPTAGSAGNPVAGYGTMLTSNVTNAATQPTPGFDVFTSTGPSIEIYDSLSGNYFSPTSTALPIYNPKGYFVFVRGDRSITSAFTAANPTILRTKGTLFTPANTPPVTNVAPSTFESVGNPYASAIDMRTISKPGVDDFFYVWDPRLGGQNGYGAFQTLYKSGSDYLAIPGGTITYGSGPIDYIQSGQAFLVHNSNATPGTVNFAETNKANGSALFTTPNPVNQVQQILITNLRAFNADGTTSLADGVLSNFDDAYSNAVDGMDARKSINTGENLAIKTGGKLLAIERRQPPTPQDTIFLNITGEKAQQYRFHFDAENLDPSVQGFLVDNYANTRTPLNMTGSTDVDFTVANVTGSNAANRFMIVFEPLKALPVTFTSITAYKQDKNIDVQWRVDNEANMKQYEVDKSTDGNKFTVIATKLPTANNGGSAVYVIADTNPVEGFNYYRVKSLDVNGKTSYTSIVKVLVGSLKQDITIYPNPITDGMIHLQFKNEDAGKYHIRLLNNPGQLILQQQFTHAGGNATDLIKWDYNLAHGMYQLEVTKPDGTVKDINVMY